MRRARLSLEGLSLGDAFGERFFVHPAVAEGLIARRAMPVAPWRTTDDTEMAVSVVEVLAACGEVDENRLAAAFAARYMRDPHRGYGGAAHDILHAIGAGVPWQEASRRVFDGMGSLGNGGGMRSAPVGAYFADDTSAVVEHAARSARVTHYHPEGQAGAVGIALGACFAWCSRHAPQRVTGHDLLSFAHAHMPSGATRDGIERAIRIGPAASVASAVEALGSGARVTAPDTVPFALWSANRHLNDFVESMWNTVAGLGDRDTTCAMVGGIVALAAAKLPTEWLAARESLPPLD